MFDPGQRQEAEKIAGIILIAELVIAMVSAVAYLISGIVVGGWMAVIIIVSGLIGVALMAVNAWITALAMDALGEAAEGKAEAESMAVEVREMRQEMSALKMLLTSDASMESARQAQVRAEAQAIAKEKAMEEAQSTTGKGCACGRGREGYLSGVWLRPERREGGMPSLCGDL